jgi:PAS domain S-box-containing protein
MTYMNQSTILVVDHDQKVLKFVRDVLEPDFEYLYANNGQQALEISAKDKPSLILLNPTLPDMSGFDVCAKLKSDLHTEDIPVIFITNAGNVEHEVRGLEIGGEDFISKPITPAVINARVGRIFQRVKLEGMLRSSRDDLRILIDNIQTQVWYQTDEHTYGAVNKAHASFRGFSPKEIAKRDMRTLLPKDVTEVYEQACDDVFNTGTPAHSDKWIPDATGTPRLLSILKTPKLDENGQVEYVICSAVDITEQKQCDAKLQSSEQQFRTLFMESPTSIIIHDKDTGEIVDANPATYALYKVADVHQLRSRNIWHDPPYSFNDALGWIKKTIDQGPQSFEWLNRNSNGDFFWEQVRLTKIVIDGVERVMATTIDITELKNALKELEESEAKYRYLVHNANSIILRMNTDGVVTYLNEYAQSFFGYTTDELIGKNVVGTIVPEKDKVGKNLKNLIQDINKNPEKYRSNENENMLKDGRKVWVAWTNKAILDENGKFTEVLCIGRDITELKRALDALEVSESKYRAIAEDTPLLLCRFLPGCKITYVNRAYCRYFGRSADEMVGTSFLALIPESDRNTFLANIASLSPESPTISHDHQVICPDGQLRWQRWTEHALFDAHGGLRGYQSVGEDVTEVKRLDAELKASREKYRAIYKKSPLAIAVLDRTGSIIDTNPSCNEMFGVEGSPVMNGCPLLSYFTLKPEGMRHLSNGATVSCSHILDFEQLKKRHNIQSSRLGYISMDVKITPLDRDVSGQMGYLLQMQDVTWSSGYHQKVA